MGICPYKMFPVSAAPGAAVPQFPNGCPGNMSRLGWYIAFVNAKLRQRGSLQRVSMMNWDAEGNGPTGLQCATFQFLYALRQFGVVDDINPAIVQQLQTPLNTTELVASKWRLYQNGSAGLMDAAGTADPETNLCG